MKPDFNKIKKEIRGFAHSERRLVGGVPTIALTPVADGRTGAYEENAAKTWALVEKVYKLIAAEVRLYDGQMPNIVVAPEIVYGARTGAVAQEYYKKMGVSANIWISRSWAYSDELMSACMGCGSSEWQQAAYGLNQTDRPGAVWLKAFCAAMDEKKRPIFSIYNPDLEDESKPFTSYVATRLVRFSRAACAVAEMRGKNYLAVGGVSMGIIGSDVRRNMFHDYFGMGSVSVDMTEVKGRMETGFFDSEELEKSVTFMKKFDITFGKGKRPLSNNELLRASLKMTLIVRDLMVGNEKLAEIDVEKAQGHHAIAAGTQGQRAWTDYYPNFDLTESILSSSFDWNGFRAPFIVATENDSKNAIGMTAAMLLTGASQLFADIRTNWTVKSVRDRTGINVSKVAPGGFIDKRNSGAASLDYSLNILKLAGVSTDDIYKAIRKLQNSKTLQNKLIKESISNTTYMAAVIEYFLGDGLSSHFTTPGNIPMTSYRYNTIGDKMTVSIIEGKTVSLPKKVIEEVSSTTNSTWPETYWAPNNMSSFDYMRKIGPNHDANSFGSIGADLITLNSMLRIPVDMQNVAEKDIFRPTIWDRFAGDDFRACETLGPLYI